MQLDSADRREPWAARMQSALAVILVAGLAPISATSVACAYPARFRPDAARSDSLGHYSYFDALGLRSETFAPCSPCEGVRLLDNAQFAGRAIFKRRAAMDDAEAMNYLGLM